MKFSSSNPLLFALLSLTFAIPLPDHRHTHQGVGGIEVAAQPGDAADHSHEVGHHHDPAHDNSEEAHAVQDDHHHHGHEAHSHDAAVADHDHNRSPLRCSSGGKVLTVAELEDTLWGLAKEHNRDYEALRDANSQYAPSYALVVDDEICVPEGCGEFTGFPVEDPYPYIPPGANEGSHGGSHGDSRSRD